MRYGPALFDVPILDEGRFCYGVGMHMCNDALWSNGTEDAESDTKNNARIYASLVLGADEITCCYNYGYD